jgi:hypothetical protein
METIDRRLVDSPFEDIPEEETYKFCMRTRMEDSHLMVLEKMVGKNASYRQ